MTPAQPQHARDAIRAAIAAGRAGEAEPMARALTIGAPSPEAFELLSLALRAQGKADKALAAAEDGLRLDLGNVRLAHARGLALTELGRNEEALRTFDSLARRGLEQPPVWLSRGVALLNLARDADAEAMFADGVRRWPQDQGLHHGLASVRWMRGQGAAFTRDFEAAVARNPDALHLRIACADMLRRADFRERAEALLREGLRRAPQQPALMMSLAVLLDEMDRTAEGLPLLEQAAVQAPDNAQVSAQHTALLLRLGRGDEALKAIVAARTLEPLNQEWICYETMALRQLGDPRYHELCDYDAMVRPFELPVPPGYRDIAAFNEAFAASLNQLHVLATHPLDQSLRHGSQTTRSLLQLNDPVVQSYFKALDEPIRAYMGLMQNPDHPWSGRKTGEYRIAGAWSVKLKANGYHINHLHPQGWISSAYYVHVPKAVAEAPGQQGWIKFGEPRWPTPGCSVEKIVQPRAGLLVLFPSYMWHGTIPFAEGERMTAPIDVVPA
ncbi:MAG: tetratricopeptide repeat protein [Proteobacteria bacterium]|nr:tetratricopeptide repeat protein [Pseudomonadota bacterium]